MWSKDDPINEQKFRCRNLENMDNWPTSKGTRIQNDNFAAQPAALGCSAPQIHIILVEK